MGAILNSPSYIQETCDGKCFDTEILKSTFKTVYLKATASSVQVPYDLNCEAKGIFVHGEKKIVKDN